MINLKVRLKNKAFYVTAIPLVLVIITQVLAIFGVKVEFSVLSDQLVELVETVFLLLGLLGVVVDPTTEGISDSKQALTYDVPKED